MVTFGEFLASELDGLIRFAAVLTGDRDQAHEALADGLERAQRRWDRIGKMDHPTAYVRRVVTSAFLSQLRRWSARTIRPTRTGELPEVAAGDPTRAVDDRAEIAQLLAGLPPRQRVVVVLGYYIGLSTAEIAEEMGITPGAVRTAHAEAMRRLRIAAADGRVREQASDATTRADRAPRRTPSYRPAYEIEERP